jgi:hypothetical protein
MSTEATTREAPRASIPTLRRMFREISEDYYTLSHQAARMAEDEDRLSELVYARLSEDEQGRLAFVREGLPRIEAELALWRARMDALGLRIARLREAEGKTTAA